MNNYIAHIWLDDIRIPPRRSYIWVKDFDSFVEAVKDLGENISGCIVHFDHDLGLEKDGYDCAKWLINWCLDNDYGVPDYDIQSANPVGKQNIESIFESYWKVYFNEKSQT